MGKYCCFDNCRSDSRTYKNVRFYPIPKPGRNGRNLSVCQKWVECINRETITVATLKQHHYVCNLHFANGIGPTEENPFPSRLPDKEPCHLSLSINVNKSGMKSYSKHQPDINEPQSQLETSTYDSDKLNMMVVNPVALIPTIVTLPMIYSVKLEENSEIIVPSDSEPLFKQELLADEPIISEPMNEEFTLSMLLKDLLQHQEENKDTFLWTVSSEPNLIILCKREGILLSARFEVSQLLEVEVFILERSIMKTHTIFSYGSKLNSSNELLDMTSNFDCNWSVCWGVSGTLFDSFLKHSHNTIAKYCPESDSFRSNRCQYIKKKSTGWCINCRLLRSNLFKRLKRKEKNIFPPARTTLRNLDLQQIRMRMSNMKVKNKALVRKNKALRKKIENLIATNENQLTTEESDEVCKIFKETPFETPTKFQRFLLHQQLQIANSRTSRPKKWHPAIVHWCIYIKSKSSSTYEALRQVMTLPTAKTLNNYSKDMMKTASDYDSNGSDVIEKSIENEKE